MSPAPTPDRLAITFKQVEALQTADPVLMFVKRVNDEAAKSDEWRTDPGKATLAAYCHEVQKQLATHVLTDTPP